MDLLGVSREQSLCTPEERERAGEQDWEVTPVIARVCQVLCLGADGIDVTGEVGRPEMGADFWLHQLLSPCCNKMPDKINSKEGILVLAHSFDSLLRGSTCLDCTCEWGHVVSSVCSWLTSLSMLLPDVIYAVINGISFLKAEKYSIISMHPTFSFCIHLMDAYIGSRMFLSVP